MLAAHTNKVDIAVVPNQHYALVAVTYRALDYMAVYHFSFKLLVHFPSSALTLFGGSRWESNPPWTSSAHHTDLKSGRPTRRRATPRCTTYFNTKRPQIQEPFCAGHTGLNTCGLWPNPGCPKLRKLESKPLTLNTAAEQFILFSKTKKALLL